MDMVEKVADAILAEAGRLNSPQVQDDLALATTRLWAKRYARAAIEAMREPTEGMLSAAPKAKLAPGYTDNGADELPIWDNMSCPSRADVADWEAVLPGVTKGFFHPSYEWPEWQEAIFRAAWRSMIDAALSPKP